MIRITLFTIVLSAALAFTAQADQTNSVLWKVKMDSRGASEPLAFSLVVPDDGCQTAEVMNQASATVVPKAALKICMGNSTLAPHAAYGWLVTDPQEAAKAGHSKYEKGERFILGFSGDYGSIDGSLYSVQVSKQ